MDFLVKVALNKYEKHLLDNMPADKILDVSGADSLKNMSDSQKMKLHDTVRRTAKGKMRDVNQMASTAEKKLPSGVQKEKGKLFGLLPGKKETTYGTGTATSTPKRERVRQAIDRKKHLNDKARLKKDLFNPATAAGAGAGYVAGGKLGKEENRGRNKALGALGGAALGGVLRKKLR